MDPTKLPFPRFAKAAASSASLYGIIVETGPKASTSWDAFFSKGLSL